MAVMIINVLDRVENIVGKGGHQHFLLFPECFHDFFSIVAKTQNWKIKPFPNKPWFLHVCSTSLLKNLWENGKVLVTSNFSFSERVLYLFGELSIIFSKFKIVVCKLFQFGTV